MLKMLVSISTLGRRRSQSRGLFIYVIAIISSFRRIFCSVHSSIFIYRLQCWFNCYSRDCPTGFSLFYFAALSLKCLNYNYVWNSVCFGFGKYEITAQIETFVWIFFLLRGCHAIMRFLGRNYTTILCSFRYHFGMRTVNKPVISLSFAQFVYQTIL